MPWPCRRAPPGSSWSRGDRDLRPRERLADHAGRRVEARARDGSSVTIQFYLVPAKKRVIEQVVVRMPSAAADAALSAQVADYFASFRFMPTR